MSVSVKKETIIAENKTDFLDSLDSKKTLTFNKIYTVLAFWVVLAPLTTTLFYSIGIKFEISMQWIIAAFLFGLAWFVQFAFSLTKLKLKKPDLFQILGYCLIGLFFIVMFLSGVKQFTTLLLYSSYILLFCLFFKLDKKYYKILAYTFIIEMTLDAILGIIDLDNKWIPGFEKENYAFSLQFGNPNYAAYIVVFAIILCIYYFLNGGTKFDKITSGICFVLLNVFLFFNGTFVAETTLFIVEVALIVIYWIKNKKFPLWLGLAFLITFICSFFRINRYSSSATIYIFEVFAMMDSYLGTNIIGFILDNFKGSEKIIYGLSSAMTKEEILAKAINISLKEPQWNRGGLASRAIEYCVSGFMPFVFGNGIGFANEVVRPHNLFLWWWIDLGIVFSLLFYAMCVVLIVMFARCKNREKFLYPFIVFCAYLFMYNFGVIDYSFIFFVINFALLYKGLKTEKEKPLD